MKKDFKSEAIKLRKKGKSYSQILSVVPVSHSSLSIWLRDIKLSELQKANLEKRQVQGSLKGALIRKNDRILRSKKIKESASGDIDKLSKRELWLIGVALYWAEGSKEKDGYDSIQVGFEAQKKPARPDDSGRSGGEHCIHIARVAGSNPATPT